MGALNFDLKNFPLVLLVGEGENTFGDADRHFREYRQILDRNVPYALVCDATKMSGADAKLRKGYADFLKDNEKDFRRLCKGVAFVFGNAAIRGAFTAILWFTDMPFAYTICSTREDALVWARGRLAGR